MIIVPLLKFREEDFYLSQLYGSEVHLCDENYTTQACGGCGLLDKNIGGNKMYKCRECNVEIDRDYNAARNIYLKHMK